VFVICSSFQRCRLQIALTPTSAPLNADFTNTLWNCIMDIETGNEREFEVGWFSNLPALPCNGEAANGSNGYLQVMLLTPLVSQSYVSGVMVCVFGSAGPDMDFSVPRPFAGATGTTGVTPFVSSVSVRNQGQVGDGKVGTERCHLGGKDGVPMASLLAGESVRSVKALMQKPSLVLATSLVTGGGGVPVSQYWGVQMPFYPAPNDALPVAATSVFTVPFVVGPVITYGSPPFSWLGYYGALFGGLRGGVVCKVSLAPTSVGTDGLLGVPRITGYATTNLVASRYSTDSVYNNGNPALAGSTMPGLFGSGEEVTSGMEFRFPNYDNYKFRSSFTNANPISDGLLVKSIYWEIGNQIPQQSSATAVANLYVYQSGASDIVGIYFLRAWPLGQILS